MKVETVLLLLMVIMAAALVFLALGIREANGDVNLLEARVRELERGTGPQIEVRGDLMHPQEQADGGCVLIGKKGTDLKLVYLCSQ